MPGKTLPANIANTANESTFLQAFFQKLNDASIRYAILRNFETLPYATGGSDLDIIIHADDAEKVKKIVFDAVKHGGGVPVGYIETVGWFSVFACGYVSNQDGKKLWWGAVLDFFSSHVLFNGAAPFFEADWNNTGVHNGVSIIPNGQAAALGVLKEALYNSHIPDRYRVEASAALHSNRTEFIHAFRPLGDKALQQFMQLLSEEHTKEEARDRCGLIRKALRQKNIRQSPVRYFYHRVLFELSKVRRYISPSGTVISIQGVDGVGKSTVIDGILPVLKAATHNATYVHHLRPGFLPPLARFKGETEVNTEAVLDPHGAKPSGTIGSLVRLTYLTLDYIIGYWLKIRPKIAKQPAIIIFDRYAYDMQLDPRRFRISLSPLITGWFARLAPRPDIVICLHADPAMIIARKQELPAAEIERQVTALRAFAAKNPRAILISNEGDVAEVTDKVLQALYDFFAQRNPPE